MDDDVVTTLFYDFKFLFIFLQIWRDCIPHTFTKSVVVILLLLCCFYNFIHIFIHRFHFRLLLPSAKCLTLTLSLEAIPCNIAIIDIPLKTTFFGLHFRRRKYLCIFNHFYVIRPKATEFGEITVPLVLLRRSRSPILVPIESSYTTSY